MTLSYGYDKIYIYLYNKLIETNGGKIRRMGITKMITSFQRIQRSRPFVIYYPLNRGGSYFFA